METRPQPTQRLDELLDCSGLTRTQSNEVYEEALSSRNTDAQRLLCRKDLFYLLTVGCRRRDIDRDWLYERCREVQANADGYLDLWAREHYKSTIITFGKSIQDLLVDPDNTTIGIFSHTRPMAKGFLDQIKRELEANEYLKGLFPDVLYQNPHAESPKWSLDQGIIVKRQTNPKEGSVEAWGLVDGQPTSKHFTVVVFDDVVTRESVTTPDQIKKVTGAWELALNLGSQSGRRRTIGTRYHVNDTYRTMMDRGSAISRIYPATDNGKVDGNPVLLPRELLTQKRTDMGPYTFGTQMLQDPVADRAMTFKQEWVKHYETLGDMVGWNKYVLVDPASSKKDNGDYTVMMVLGLAPDQNYYLIDAVRDRLNLTQRATKLFELHRKYAPRAVGYEQYGMQADIEHVEYVMEQKNYRFNITPLAGGVAKEDRIKKLIPIFEQKRVYLPKVLPYADYEGRSCDFVKNFLTDEYLAFPVCAHDDMLDCLARILDLDAAFPKVRPKGNHSSGNRGNNGGLGWMG